LRTPKNLYITFCYYKNNDLQFGEKGMKKSEYLRTITIRKTPIIIRCPHCGKIQRLVIGLIKETSHDDEK